MPVHNVSVTIKSNSIGLQLFDYCNAAKLNILGHDINWLYNASTDADTKILFAPLGSNISQSDIQSHDFIFFSTNDEPLTASDSNMQQYLSWEKSYVICNSFPHENHPLYRKIIWFSNDQLLTRQFWTNAFFPQYHLLKTQKDNHHRSGMIFINGSNRSWRYHYMQHLNGIPNLKVISNLDPELLRETNDAYWETKFDKEFREFVNNNYPITRNRQQSRHNDAVEYNLLSRPNGFASSMLLLPCYFIIEEFYQHHCVIFPETTWLNHELALTEKICKCFFSKTMPFPIGGVKLNQLYNRLGFATAWNFLPDNLKFYDDVEDHMIRTKMIVDSVDWLSKHSEIYKDVGWHESIEKNYQNYLTNCTDHVCIDKIRDILTTRLEEIST